MWDKRVGGKKGREREGGRVPSQIQPPFKYTVMPNKKLKLANQILKCVEPKASSLEPYQCSFLEAGDRDRMALKSRQTGLSTIITIEAIIDALDKEKWTVLFLSKNQQDANRLLARSKEALQGLLRLMYGDEWPEYYEGMVTGTDSATNLKFSNGSELISLSASPRNARQFTASRVYLDEFAFVDDATAIWEAVIPTTTLGGLISVISTPNGTDGQGETFYRLWEAREELGFWSIEVPYTSSSRLIGREDDLRRKLEVTGGGSFEQEYECSFKSIAGGVWSWEELNALDVPKGVDEQVLSRGYTLMAWDPAQKEDNSAVVVLWVDGDHKYVVHQEDLSGKEYPVQAERVLELERFYKPHKVVLDNTGVGAAVGDLLFPISKKLERVRLNSEMKSQCATSIKSEADANRLHIWKGPFSERLKKDLFAYDKDKKGWGRKRSRKDGHWDFGTALFLVWTALKKKQTFGIWKPNRPLRGITQQPTGI